jgi:hypothetical protein
VASGRFCRGDGWPSQSCGCALPFLPRRFGGR